MSRVGILRAAVWTVILASGLFGIAALLLPTSAFGGSYVVRECYPDGVNNPNAGAPDAVYETNGALAFTAATGCFVPDGDVGMAIGTQGRYAGPLHAQWNFFSPPGTFINGVVFERNSFAGGSYAPLVEVCGASCNGVSNNTVPVDTQRFMSTQLGAGGWTAFIAYLGCSSATCNAGGYVYVRNIEFTVADVASPTIRGLGGSLLAGGARHGTESLTINASDQGAGVQEATVTVNGAEVGPRPRSNCAGGQWLPRFRPCPDSADYNVAVNTDAAPWVNGRNLVEVCARDFAQTGPANVGCTQRLVDVDNTCPNSGGLQGTELNAGLQKRGIGDLHPSVAIRSTEGAGLRGSLASGGGPVGNANICIYERIDAVGEGRQLVQTAKTKSDGGFSVAIAPGPSRVLDVVYRYNNQLVEKQHLYLDSAAVPQLKMGKRRLHNGELMRFKGSIPAPYAGNRAVTVQAKVGHIWRTFKQLRSKESGEFSGIYRFKSSTRPRTRYTFRALVKKQGSYPFSPGASQKRSVIVFG